MIKFFRKIRRKLFDEGKFKKYAFYVIGEIFLIVFGILLALQINAWRQNSVDRKISTDLFLNIKFNFCSF